MFVLYSIMQFIYQKCATHIIRLQSKHYIFPLFVESVEIHRIV